MVFLGAYRHAKHGIPLKKWIFWHFQLLFSHENKAFQKKCFSPGARAIQALSKTPLLFVDWHQNKWLVAGMPKPWNWRNYFQKMLFGMPATIHAKLFLSIKSRGDLERAWTALVHGLIHFFWKALFSWGKCIWKCWKIHFLNEIPCLACPYAPKNANTENFHWISDTPDTQTLWNNYDFGWYHDHISHMVWVF